VHPILINRDYLILYLAAWLPIAALLTGILARGSDMPWTQAVAIAAPMCFLYAFVCLASWYICRTAGGSITALGTAAASAVFSSTVWVLIGSTWAKALELVPSFAGLGDRYRNQIAVLFLSGVLLFLLAVAVHFLLVLLEESRAAEKRALELQVLAREAELRALRAQIDPHFLFNSLNSISALTLRDPAAARRMCLLLADFTRATLAAGGRPQITFKEELRLVEGFLDIEKVRFGERLSVNLRVSDGCLDCLVPPLLIQPLVENAVTHGIAPLVEGGTVSIEARRDGTSLEIVLENPYDPEESGKKGTGLGMHNVRERLAKRYDAQAKMDVHRDNRRFAVVVRLPCM